jgi:hypothetical protein
VTGVGNGIVENLSAEVSSCDQNVEVKQVMDGELALELGGKLLD